MVETAKTEKKFSGAEKVSMLLLAMEKDIADRILKYFNTGELRLIAKSAAEIGTIPVSSLSTVVDEFSHSFNKGADLLGSISEVRSLLSGILPSEQVNDIISDVLGASNQAMWERVSTVPDTELAQYLIKEHPQTIALALSKVFSSCSAKVLTHLPTNLRKEVMRRMLSSKPVIEQTMRSLEGAMYEDLLTNMTRNTGADTNSKIADIINKMEREHMEEVLNDLAETKPKTAEILRSLLFTFEDIIKLSAQARTVVMDKIPSEKIIVALRGASDDLRDSILSSMAARTRRIVEHELKNGAALPQKEILKARRAIADVVLQMIDKGEIEMDGDSEDTLMA